MGGAPLALGANGGVTQAGELSVQLRTFDGRWGCDQIPGYARGFSVTLRAELWR